MTAENQNEEPSQEGTDQRNLSIQGSADDSILVLGDRNTINQGPSYYTTNVFGSFDANQLPVRPSQQLSQQEYRWRQVLVQNVKHYWIEGVLERSLHNRFLIELGLEKREQAVCSPIGAAKEFVEDTGRPYPVGAQATDIFDDLGAGRTLLILGEPGAGKTTTLLKLTKTLIARIDDDFSQPIPVVLNLSSWGKKRQTMAEWLVQSLYETFQVSKSLGTTWIEEEQLTLCLDGLDEIAAEHRNACVQELNHFLRSHGRTEIVVCSRIHDYEALPEKLRLRCAIYVQPLTSNQIDQYIEQAGEQLSILKIILNQNKEIKSFAASPLILSVMSLAYRGYSLEQFTDLANAQSFRQRLFNIYIERMFRRRGTTNHYDNEQAKHWLIWMARQMVNNSQTVFFIENIQPSWLPTLHQRLWYRLESSIIFGLIFGFIFGLIAVLIAGLIAGARTGLMFGLIYGLIAGLVSGLIAITLGDITPVETLKWSWKEAKRACRYGLMFGLIYGLIYGIGFGLISRLIGGLSNGLSAGLSDGLSGGLIVGLSAWLIGGLRGPRIGNKQKSNQGIWESARNAGLFTLCSGLIGGLVGSLSVGLIFGLRIGLIGGLISGLSAGGSACIRHFSLRLMLYCMGYIPWNYARFLDYATEHLFLQKVGGGYIFIHRMLLEHFAQMELEQKPSK